MQDISRMRPPYGGEIRGLFSGWQRQAESSQLADGFLAFTEPSAKQVCRCHPESNEDCSFRRASGSRHSSGGSLPPYFGRTLSVCTGDDILDERLWPREPGWYNGPGDNRPVFDEILRRIEHNHQ